MIATLGTSTWRRTDHLRDLVATTGRLADDVGRAVAAGSTAPQLWDRAVIASCRLDGSPHDTTPTDGDTTSLVDDDSPTEDVWRREYAGVRRALAADDLAELLQRDVLAAIQGLHRLLTVGLVATDLRGRLRRNDVAVHTGGEGRQVFRPVAPDRLAREMATLPRVVADADHHPLEVAGILQFDLLRLHPFESANGRLARAAARLVLRGAGLDPGGLAVPEIAMAQRRAGNYDEVAAALRSGDRTRFLEGWGEDVTAGLRLAATTLGVQPPPVDPDLVAGLPTAFTLVDVADRLGQSDVADRLGQSDVDGDGHGHGTGMGTGTGTGGAGPTSTGRGRWSTRCWTRAGRRASTAVVDSGSGAGRAPAPPRPRPHPPPRRGHPATRPTRRRLPRPDHRPRPTLRSPRPPTHLPDARPRGCPCPLVPDADASGPCPPRVRPRAAMRHHTCR